ncbi:MAG: DUF542 domain-containing protein [Gemmatimonadetes bacterium]|nr:DUF542 domain-containing protein [Gemmatimonadota bacterium]
MQTGTVAPLRDTMTLNEIVAAVPRAVEVFERFGLDSCCGGARPLAVICVKHGLNPDLVLRALRELA